MLLLEVPSAPAEAGISSLLKGVYIPKDFVLHAALLRQAFAHCAKFPTAASRRSLGRVSVPVWPITLSGRLSITALVSFYLTNKLMDRRLILQRNESFRYQSMCLITIWGISPGFPRLSPSEGHITYVLLTRLPLSIKDSCPKA